MPYFLVPKGQPDAWIFAFPMDWHPAHQPQLSEHRCDLRETYYTPYVSVLCSACGRQLGRTETPYFYCYYSYYQCERCIAYARTQPIDAALQPSHTPYASRSEALRALDPKTHEIVFRPSEQEQATWNHREARRFETGEYVHLPWHRFGNDKTAYHYAHYSIKKPGMVEFIRDAEAGHVGKYTTMKPGRYLQEFYSFDADTLARYIAECAAFATATYSLATTPDDIARIYNTAKGPDSCMRRKSHAEYDWQTLLDSDRMPCHPCSIYGNSDLALAYTGPIENISQRCIVWPEKKRYVRIYGTGPLALLLQRDGYTKGDFRGARLRKVEFTDPYSEETAIVTPYVDRPDRENGSGFTCDTADIDGDWLVLRNSHTNGEVNLGVTCGHNSDDIRCEEEPETFECQGCGNNYESLDDNYCDDCWNERYISCFECDRTVDRDEAVAAETGYFYCQRCVDRAMVDCASEDCCETFTEFLRSSAERRNRRAHGVSGYCETCAARIIAEREATTTDALPFDSASVPDGALWEVQVRRAANNLRQYTNPARVRPDEWYVVSFDDRSLSGTLADCEALAERMRTIHPTSRYRVMLVPVAAPSEVSSESPF